MANGVSQSRAVVKTLAERSAICCDTSILSLVAMFSPSLLPDERREPCHEGLLELRAAQLVAHPHRGLPDLDDGCEVYGRGHEHEVAVHSVDGLLELIALLLRVT